MSEERLSRVENKLDKLSEAVVEMARMEERLLTIFKRLEHINAASWHSSKIFLKELDNLNDWNYRNKNQLPKIILKPLPARAQFLNVIESVFSGMSNSVIQNSNYDSVDEMKKAIDRYFEERNNFFRQNQHSAGNKIWGRERTKPTFSVSNNCKTPFFGKRNPA